MCPGCTGTHSETPQCCQRGTSSCMHPCRLTSSGQTWHHTYPHRKDCKSWRQRRSTVPDYKPHCTTQTLPLVLYQYCPHCSWCTQTHHRGKTSLQDTCHQPGTQTLTPHYTHSRGHSLSSSALLPLRTDPRDTWTPRAWLWWRRVGKHTPRHTVPSMTGCRCPLMHHTYPQHMTHTHCCCRH